MMPAAAAAAAAAAATKLVFNAILHAFLSNCSPGHVHSGTQWSSQ